MNRSAEQLDELIQELSAHHGDDSFAVIDDIVRANISDTDEAIFHIVASILGGVPFVRPVKVLRRPQETNSSILSPPTTTHVPSPSNTHLAPDRPIHKAAKSVLPTDASANPFDVLDKKPKKPITTKPIQSVWKTVVNEHRSDTYEDIPLDPNDESQYGFDEVDINTLEDVDPVAFEMARNPDFFKDVASSEEYQPMLIQQTSEMAPVPSATTTSNARKPQLLHSTPDLVSQTLILDSDDEKDEPSATVSSSLPSHDIGLPAWMTSSSANFVVRNQLPSPSSRASIASSSIESSSSHTLPGNTGPSNSSAQIDFWLPHPTSNEEEYRRLQGMLALSASGNSTMRASSNWSASGEYAIAPSPSGLRHSSSVSISRVADVSSPEMIDLTHLPDEQEFVLDVEALDFLGQVFPDFEASYLADCLRGANNDVECVSEFLMPVEMEEIAIEDESGEVPFDESLYLRDPSHPYPQYEIPSHLLKDDEYVYLDGPAAEEAEALDLEDDEALPEEDAAFTMNYRALVEIYPLVDREWVVDALINTDNDLERAADLLMRGVTPDSIDVSQVGAANVANGEKRPQQSGKRGRNRRAKKVAILLPPPNAWARPLPANSDAPLSEYPVLSNVVPEYYDASNRGPILIRPVPSLPSVGDGSPQLPRNVGSYGDVMKVALPAGMSRERAYGTLILKKMLEDEAALQAKYVSVEDREHAKGNWALLMARANALFEKTNGGRKSAVATFARHRHAGTVHIISQLQATNESWMKLVEEAGEQFYIARIPTLDLHGLRLRPASKFVAAILQTHWTKGSEQRSLEIITGRGAHSVAGIARIKDDIRRQIRDYYHIWTNPGCVKVLLPVPNQ